MRYDPNQPLAVQSDMTVLLEARHERFREVRDRLTRFAELVKSPESLHTYRITRLSLWNAAAAGMRAEDVLACLQSFNKFDVPAAVRGEIENVMGRYGQIRLIADPERPQSSLKLVCASSEVAERIGGISVISEAIRPLSRSHGYRIPARLRGAVKQQLLKLGYPVSDEAGYDEGETLGIALREDGDVPFRLRDYQRDALQAFFRGGTGDGGSGVIVLPCGAGKTIVGIAAMAALQCETLILTTNAASVQQWKREIAGVTTLPQELVGEYTGTRKTVSPVTIATYQILTHRRTKQDEFVHMGLFQQRKWGLIIYDEVHLLPAPVFRATADIQATRRLGLTATLVREDGREDDVFSLVGPKRFEAPWKALEERGWIATAECRELRVPLSREDQAEYAQADFRSRHRIAAENPNKLPILRKLLERHEQAPTLIIGQYLDQLRVIAETFGIPFISGQMPHDERNEWFDRFRAGEIRRLVMSKVANFAIDLPDAAVCIQVSGSFGSRQEEAQRLGRVLRPKAGEGGARFYSLVSRGTNEQEFALHRRLFLLEQGYRYETLNEDDKPMVEGVRA